MFVGIIIVGTLFLIALAGFLLPKNIFISRSIEIDSTNQEIFSQISDLENFKEWNPWAKKDPNINVVIKGKGKGSSYNWKGNNKVRQGSLTIIEITEMKRVDFELNFGQKNNAETSLIIEKQKELFKVSWTMNSNMGNNPTSRYMGLFMDKFVGKDYEEGLKNLKKSCENKKS
jgi:hypothetical protein